MGQLLTGQVTIVQRVTQRESTYNSSSMPTLRRARLLYFLTWPTPIKSEQLAELSATRVSATAERANDTVINNRY